MKIVNKIELPLATEFCDAVDAAKCELVIAIEGDLLVFEVRSFDGYIVLRISKKSENFYDFKQLLELACKLLSNHRWEITLEDKNSRELYTAGALVVGPRTVKEFYPVIDGLILQLSGNQVKAKT